jgi:hypothetical protein
MYLNGFFSVQTATDMKMFQKIKTTTSRGQMPFIIYKVLILALFTGRKSITFLSYSRLEFSVEHPVFHLYDAMFIDF